MPQPVRTSPPQKIVMKKTGSVKSIMAWDSLTTANAAPEYSMCVPSINSVSASGMSNGTNVSFACAQRMATTKAMMHEALRRSTPFVAW